MHAVHVRPYDSGHDAHQMDPLYRSVGYYGMDRRPDSLLHCLSALQWLLGSSTTESAVYYA